jgi:hypothetical protein
MDSKVKQEIDKELNEITSDWLNSGKSNEERAFVIERMLPLVKEGLPSDVNVTVRTTSSGFELTWQLYQES